MENSNKHNKNQGLEKALEALKLSKSDLAKKLRVDRSTITKWSSLDRPMPLSTVRKIIDLTKNICPISQEDFIQEREWHERRGSKTDRPITKPFIIDAIRFYGSRANAIKRLDISNSLVTHWLYGASKVSYPISLKIDKDTKGDIPWWCLNFGRLDESLIRENIDELNKYIVDELYSVKLSTRLQKGDRELLNEILINIGKADG